MRVLRLEPGSGSPWGATTSSTKRLAGALEQSIAAADDSLVEWRRCQALLDHAEAAVVAAHVPETAVGVDDHLADPDVLGGQCEHPQLVGLGIEPDHGVGLD